ncbi:hypothetical protein ACJX0J_029069 [Zea mays]
MSLIIRYVNDTTGQGLFDVLQDELNRLDLDINDVRGLRYDNGVVLEVDDSDNDPKTTMQTFQEKDMLIDKPNTLHLIWILMQHFVNHHLPHSQEDTNNIKRLSETYLRTFPVAMYAIITKYQIYINITKFKYGSGP